MSANVGDQFTAANAHLVPKVFQAFYFSINFGSFFSTLLASRCCFDIAEPKSPLACPAY